MMHINFERRASRYPGSHPAQGVKPWKQHVVKADSDTSRRWAMENDLHGCVCFPHRRLSKSFSAIKLLIAMLVNMVRQTLMLTVPQGDLNP
jgi:hypothetical protein